MSGENKCFFFHFNCQYSKLIYLTPINLIQIELIYYENKVFQILISFYSQDLNLKCYLKRTIIESFELTNNYSKNIN